MERTTKRGVDCGQRMTFAVDLDALRKQVRRCFF
jgi:hypothetical protein